MYYGSYSLPTYVTIWNAEAFVETTVVPVLLMMVVNYLVLRRKLGLVAAEVSAAGFEPTKAETRHAAESAYSVLYPVPLKDHFPECG